MVIEWEMHAGEGNDEHLCRHVDIFHGDGTRVDNHVLWCPGMWNPDTIARQRTEAPMSRW